MEKEKRKVVCVSCRKEVVVDLEPFGSGHIALCPVCKKLAYNGK